MKPLDLTALSWNDFVANGVFFIVDIILLSILVPYFIGRADNKKWEAARLKIGEHSVNYLHSLNYEFFSLADQLERFYISLPEAIVGDSDAYTEEGLKKQRQVLHMQFREDVNRLEDNLGKRENAYLQEIQILTPCFTSALAIDVMLFYERTSVPKNLGLALVHWWTVITSEGVESNSGHTMVVTDQFGEGYSATERQLQKLCTSAGLKPDSSKNRTTISQPSTVNWQAQRSPTQPTLVESLRRIADILNAPLPPPFHGPRRR